MAIKVIAQRREVKLGKNPGMKFVMRPDLQKHMGTVLFCLTESADGAAGQTERTAFYAKFQTLIDN